MIPYNYGNMYYICVNYIFVLKHSYERGEKSMNSLI